MHIDFRLARRRLRRRGLDDAAIAQWVALHRRATFARDHLTTARGQPWRVRPYQRRSLESWAERKVHCDGRDVGKTSEIEIIACWAMVCRPNTEMLIATQCENHLFPLMHRLQRRFKTTPEFAPALVEMRQTPSWFFRFSNGFILWGRIAGPRGMNFQGMHVDWQIVDEAQEMTETAWAELLQALNGGGRRWVYGVPNGLRNTFYRLTQLREAEQYNWPSALNPTFTPEKDEELARLYGGRESPGYRHRVLGQHGAPAHAVFALDDYLACVQTGHDYAVLHLTREDTHPTFDTAPAGAYYLGADLGYARDPSELVVYRNEPPNFIAVLRVHLQGLDYAAQQAVLEALDRAYAFRRVAIDAGNSGRAVAHHLQQLGPRWCAMLDAVEFGGSIDLPPLPDGRPRRRRTKEFMTECIQRRLAEHTLVFGADPDREQQYAGHTYTVNSLGQVVYQKGNDHIIDADRCALLAHWRDTTEPWDAPPPLLGTPVAAF